MASTGSAMVPVDVITLLPGIGVVGDAHAGVTVQHRSRVAADPSQPNLRQVHLLQSELFDELREQGFDVHPGQLGENITTAGLDLLALPRGTRLRLGATAVVEVTGLRNRCAQIDAYMPGLRKAVLQRAPTGRCCARPRSWASSRPAARSPSTTRLRWTWPRARSNRSTASDRRGTTSTHGQGDPAVLITTGASRAPARPSGCGRPVSSAGGGTSAARWPSAGRD